MKNLIVTAALIATFGTAHAAGNLVVDGGFEAQSQAAGTFSTNASLPGWTTVGGPGIELRNAIAGTAFEGHNYVELDSTANSAMAQTIATDAGSHYTLSFEYSGRAGVSAASNPIQVSWDGATLATVTFDGAGQSDNVWHPFSFDVTGSGSDTLSFAAVGISDTLGGSLDAVSLTAAVPEPSTYAMMFSGLALLGAAARRRNAKR